MLRVIDIRYGVPQFGPAAGQRGLEIWTEDDKGSVQGWDRNNPHSVPAYESLIQNLESKELMGLWTKAIDGSQGVFLYWRGGVIETTECEEEFNHLVQAISQDSITLQKELMSRGTDFGSKMLQGHVRPPFMAWFGVPRVFSGGRDWYQNFNFVFVDEGSHVELNRSEMAYREILNHNNSQILLKVRVMKDFDYLPKDVAIRKVSVLDWCGDDKVYQRCLDLNYRYYEAGKRSSGYVLT